MDLFPKRIDEEGNEIKPTFKQKIAIKGVKWAEKIAVKKAKKEMIKTSEKHKQLIDDIQEMCGTIIEKEPEEKQGTIVATVCANIIQGFDTKKEMMLVLDMVKVAIEQYWKTDGIPQKESGVALIGELDDDYSSASRSAESVSPTAQQEKKEDTKFNLFVKEEEGKENE